MHIYMFDTTLPRHNLQLVYYLKGCIINIYVLWFSSFCTSSYIHYYLLLSEILRVTGKNELLQNQGFSDFDRMRFINPSHMTSPNSTPNFTGWNSLSHEVRTSVLCSIQCKILYHSTVSISYFFLSPQHKIYVSFMHCFKKK